MSGVSKRASRGANDQILHASLLQSSYPTCGDPVSGGDDEEIWWSTNSQLRDQRKERAFYGQSMPMAQREERKKETTTKKRREGRQTKGKKEKKLAGQKEKEITIDDDDFKWTISIPKNFKEVSEKNWNKVKSDGIETFEKVFAPTN